MIFYHMTIPQLIYKFFLETLKLFQFSLPEMNHNEMNILLHAFLNIIVRVFLRYLLYTYEWEYWVKGYESLEPNFILPTYSQKRLYQFIFSTAKKAFQKLHIF